MLSHFQTQTERLVRDDSGRLLPEDLDLAIEQAVLHFSKDRPRAVIEDVTGDGTAWLDLPEGWQTDISSLIAIEYPIGSTPPEYLEGFDIYRGPESELIYLGDDNSVADGADARVTYGAAHILDEETDTIPTTYRMAVCLLAASFLCEQLASAYTGDTNSTIGADSVDHQSKSRDYAARAKDLRRRYQDLVGVEDRVATPAGAFVDFDTPPSTGGDRLFHGRRRF